MCLCVCVHECVHTYVCVCLRCSRLVSFLASLIGCLLWFWLFDAALPALMMGESGRIWTSVEIICVCQNDVDKDCCVESCRENLRC